MALSKEIAELQVTFPKGEVIATEGEKTRDLYVLLKGEVEVLHQGIELARLNKTGSFFGEMALLSGQPRSATMMASKESTMLKISPEKLPILMKNMPDLAMRMAKNLASTVASLNKELLRAKEAMLLEDFLSKATEETPQSSLEEVVPQLFEKVKQSRHDQMVQVGQSYLHSTVFMNPFTKSIEQILGLLYEREVEVTQDDGSSEVLDQVCGIDFSGAISGTFFFMVSSEALGQIGQKLVGGKSSDTFEADAMRELARQMMELTRKSVPGYNLEVTLPEMVDNFKSVVEGFKGIKLKTDLGFACWVNLR